MIDRYARDALACYGRLRHLDPGEARAELELFDSLLRVPLGTDHKVRRAHQRLLMTFKTSPLGSTTRKWRWPWRCQGTCSSRPV